MLWKAVTLLGLVVCARGEHHATSEQMVKQEFVIQHGHHGELNHIGSHVPEHHEEYAWAYPSYEFSYTVNDPHTHDHKGQYEHRKGDEVKGEYWLLQPDGKKRTVKYESNKHKGFKADVHYSEHHEHHMEPHIEEVVKPVVELIPEEPARSIEESEPILIEEIPQAVVEERQEEGEVEREIERIEPVHHKPKHHKPIHIEYYINHKYRKHHHEEQEEHHKHAEPVEERREEETGQEARIQESEEPHVELKHRKPIHIEHYAKIHHPIHNEHHGHEIPKHSAPVSIVVHHEDHEERAREEQRDREERRGREEHKGRERQRGRDEHELRGWGEHLKRGEHRGREEHHDRDELHGRWEHRGREEYRSREHHEHLPLVPSLRPLNLEHHHRYEHGPIRVEEIRPERRHEPHDQLLRLHKPVVYRPENAHHHPRSLRQEKHS